MTTATRSDTNACRLRHWVLFLAHALCVLAAWTVFIKYLFPLGFAAAQGEPLTRYIYWDLWPLAHLWLAWALIERPAYTRRLAVAIAGTEIVIIVTLLSGFLSEPQWTIWRTNWFINKIFVLTLFVGLLITLGLHYRHFAPPTREAE